MDKLHEAERRLCGVAMHRNEWIEELGELRPDHFQDPQLGNLYAVIKATISKGHAAIPATLEPAFKSQTDFENLKALYADSVPGSRKAFFSMAKLVTEAAGRRELKRACEEALALVNETNDAPLNLMGQIEALIRGVDVGSENKLMTMRDHAMSVAKGLKDPAQRGLPTGWQAIDQRIGGLSNGNLIVIAGRPGSGKSSFAMNLARNLGSNGFNGHVGSYEMGSSQIGERILGALGDLDYSQLRRSPEKFDQLEIEAIAATAPDTVIVDPTPAQSISQLEASIRASKRRLRGLHFVIVDYLQLMKGNGRQTAQERVAEVSREMKALALRLQVPIIALCQLNRATEARDGNRPQLGDMRESGAIEQDADVVFGLYREAYYVSQQEPKDTSYEEYRDWVFKMKACENVLEVITLKNRQGPTGTDKLTIHLSRDKIESFTGPVAVPSKRMRRDYE